ncbi:MAG: multidrug effflux MFS transporter [Rhizobiaceae bacterium]|nr:multidrug effflux MFS transporter [Rhizobiaceae bacterium]
MDQQVTPAATAFRLPIPRWEFIAIVAALMAVNALAIDVMLPGLQQIGASLGVEDENTRQYVISAYIAGMGVATLFFGPLSDRFGRKPPLLVGLAIYVVASFAAAATESFTVMLILRFVQGFGAASTRVIAVSTIRDAFGGRAMAEVMSLVFVVFMIVPIIAPSIGQLIMLAYDWHYIFIMMGTLTVLITIWTWLRLPETLHEEYRRPFTAGSIASAFAIVLTVRRSIWYTLAQTIMFGAMFGFINQAQQIYQGIYQVGALFPVFFAVVAGFMAISSFLNSRMVGRFGMRRLSHTALLSFITVNAVALALSWFAGPLPLWLFTLLFGMAMVQMPWIGSNFNSMAMEPVGHVAGSASSVQGFIQTIGAGLVGALIGQAFDGTTTPLAAGYFFTSVLGLVCVLVAEKGVLFRPANPPTR